MQISKLLEPPSSPVENVFYFVKPTTGAVKTMIAGNQGELVDFEHPPPTLTGPLQFFYTTTPVTYVITNYLSDETYVLSSTTGTISRTGDVVSYTPGAPFNGERTDSFTINGRVFEVLVLDETPLAPEVTYPLANQQDVAANTLLVESSSFSTNNPDSTRTHASTDWEIATDANFTTIVASSYEDTVNKTTWDPNA